MKSLLVALVLASLVGCSKSHSRQYDSNDGPVSQAVAGKLPVVYFEQWGPHSQDRTKEGIYQMQQFEKEFKDNPLVFRQKFAKVRFFYSVNQIEEFDDKVFVLTLGTTIGNYHTFQVEFRDTPQNRKDIASIKTGSLAVIDCDLAKDFDKFKNGRLVKCPVKTLGEALNLP